MGGGGGSINSLLTLIVYLNEDFGGGTTEFLDFDLHAVDREHEAGDLHQRERGAGLTECASEGVRDRLPFLDAREVHARGHDVREFAAGLPERAPDHLERQRRL